MSDETIAQPTAPAASRLEAEEVRAWRIEKVRRLPRRARQWTWRVLAFGAGAVLLLAVLGQAVTLVPKSVGGATHASAPRQK